MKNFQAIGDIISLPFTVFSCKFNSPQVQGNLISSEKNFAYELPQESSNDLSFRILGNGK